jgi:dynein heavy chain
MASGLKTFKPQMPLIRALCNPGLQGRHKKILGDALGIPGSFDADSMTPDDLKTYMTEEKKDIRDMIESISDDASKEFSNERAYQKMQEDWMPLAFTAVQCPGKDEGCYILQGDAVENI